jgi:AAA+ ATPase superfamily predicted ATPase
VGKPLTAASEALFVGREDIFMWVEENLIGKTQPHTLILHGQRRMGKTSTLYQLVDGQRGATIRRYPGYPIFPVYIDLQRFASCTTLEFFERISHEIERYLQKRGLEFALEAYWPLDIWAVSEHSYQHAFDTFLDRIEASLPENGLLVVIMDELEQLKENIERGKLSPDVLPYLRSLMQHRRQLAFILTGTNQLVEDYWSTIFHVGISREVHSLSREETERLIREPVRPMVHYDELAVDRIWQATHGHPYFTQLICHRLISTVNLEGRASKVIALDDVQHTIGKVIDEDDSQLQFIWEESTGVERLVLSALAGRPEVSDGYIARFEIMGRLRDAKLEEEHLKIALKRLEGRSLVSAQVVERPLQARLLRQNNLQPNLLSRDYTYSVSFELLRRWVATKHPLDLLLN